jgi:hypothetical protein
LIGPSPKKKKKLKLWRLPEIEDSITRWSYPCCYWTDSLLFKDRVMPTREVRHKFVKPVRKGETMILGKTGFMGKTGSTLQLN